MVKPGYPGYMIQPSLGGYWCEFGMIYPTMFGSLLEGSQFLFCSSSGIRIVKGCLQDYYKIVPCLEFNNPFLRNTWPEPFECGSKEKGCGVRNPGCIPLISVGIGIEYEIQL